MPNLPKPNGSKAGASITFRCDPEWKRRVMSTVALRGQTLEDACRDAVAKHLKVYPTKESAA